MTNPTEPDLRTFLALTLERDSLEGLVRVQRELEQSFRSLDVPLRPTRPEQLHVTVAFLGRTRREQILHVARVADEIAHRHAPLSLSFDRILLLPKPSRAQVIALGLTDPEQIAESIAEGLWKKLQPLGFEREHRHFLAHITLFRSRSPLRIPAASMPEHSQHGLGLRLCELAFFASHLEPSGARYELLRGSRLEGTAA